MPLSEVTMTRVFASSPRCSRSCEHALEVPVEVLHLEGVVEQVVADRVVVGPEGGHAVDVGELLAALGDAGAKLVRTVRLGAAVPEAPRLAGGRGIEEVLEICRVIIVADAAGGRRELAALERGAR